MVLEFGVVFPLIVAVIVGIAYFGVGFTRRLALDQAAREGVRAYALPGDEDSDNVAAATAAVGNAMPDGMDYTMHCGTGSPDGTGCSAACDPLAPGTPPATAWVRVDHDFGVDLPFFPDGGLALSGTAVFRCGG